MSAITVAVLNDLRGRALTEATYTRSAERYRDALRKAPQLVEAGHLARAAGYLLVLAVRAAVGRARR